MQYLFQVGDTVVDNTNHEGKVEDVHTRRSGAREYLIRYPNGSGFWIDEPNLQFTALDPREQLVLINRLARELIAVNEQLQRFKERIVL